MQLPTPPDPWPLPELQRARRAIVVVDVVESVRLMQEDESGFIDRWRRFVNEVRTEVLPAHGGRLVKSLGDGMLLEFERVPQAVAAALAMQSLEAIANAAGGAASAIWMRIGVHVSEVVVDSLDAFGTGVNLAARIAGLAKPGQTVVSAQVRDDLTDILDADIEDLGDHYVKHFDDPVRLYQVRESGASTIACAPTGGAFQWPAIAVIPFKCSDESDPLHVHGEVCADDVVARLARVAQLHVISTMSSRALRTRELGARTAGSILGATYLVCGRYRLRGGRLQLFAELSDSRNGALLWAERLDGSLDSPAQTGEQVGEQVAERVLRAIMLREYERSEGRALASLDAYTLFFAAVNLMHRATATDFDRARAMLEELAWRHTRSAVAHAWLAKWHVLRVVQGWAADANAEGTQALDHTRRALDANSRDALALAVGGLVHGYLRKDLRAAGEHYEAAREANPNEPLAWLFTATWHSYRDEGAKAEYAADMALGLSPLDPTKYFFDSLAATAVLSNGNHARAIELAQRSLRANRAHASTWRTLALAQSLSGAMDDARRTVTELRRIEPQLSASSFLERYPGRDAQHAARYAQALIDAGLPR